MQQERLKKWQKDKKNKTLSFLDSVTVHLLKKTKNLTFFFMEWRGTIRIWMIPWNMFSPVLNTVWFPNNHWLIHFIAEALLLFFVYRTSSQNQTCIYTVDAVVIIKQLFIADIWEPSPPGRLCFDDGNFFVIFLTLVAFNFIVNDSRKRPIWNILMWTSLFAGVAVLLCFYSQEWYARQHCPLKNVSHQPGWSRKVTNLSAGWEGWGAVLTGGVGGIMMN